MFADYYVYVGKNVPHLPYITVTTPGWPPRWSRCPGIGRYAIVLRNHGLIAVGASVKSLFSYSGGRGAGVHSARRLADGPARSPKRSCGNLTPAADLSPQSLKRMKTG